MTTEIVQFKCQGSKDGYCIVKLKQEQELLENHREEIEFLTVFYQEQNRMNEESWKERFKELEGSMGAYERELYEKDRQIAQIENALEEVCEKLFSEMNLS